TYLRRVLRWWAGKGPAAKPQISRSAINTAIASKTRKTIERSRPLLRARWRVMRPTSCLRARLAYVACITQSSQVIANGHFVGRI
ncbi:hypothetical protein LN517_05810, partial [Xanthomonas hortorum pv. gardneri]|nr:hypothetical protein [Xanthomonas hortorum pv. gardneri]